MRTKLIVSLFFAPLLLLACEGQLIGGSDAGRGFDAGPPPPMCFPTGGYFDDPANGFGSADCDACATTQCSCEYTEYENNPSSENQSLLSQCTEASCDACFYPICGAVRDGNPIGLTFASGCVSCLNDNCCDALNACISDDTCWSCMNGSGGAECDSNALFEAQNSCIAGNCGMPGACG